VAKGPVLGYGGAVRGVSPVFALVVALVVLAIALAPASAGAAFEPLGDDQRLSFMGPNGSTGYLAESADVAYNPTANEWLVVWRGDDNTPPLVNDEFEIFAQRLSGSGAPLGGRIRVSGQGANGDPASDVGSPSVAYNAAANEYLVAWSGEIGTSATFEIWAQRLSAAGAEVGGSDFQVSDMGPGDSTSYEASSPSVTANPTANEYLVVWWGDDDTAPLVADEFEIFGQRLTAAGAHTGADDFRVSEQGADGNPNSTAIFPSVAYNAAANEYLVAWTGEIGTSETYEVWAQRLSAAGAEVGGSDFQVSDMPPGGANFTSFGVDPRVAANATANEYLVVWVGRAEDANPMLPNEPEVYGQRLTAAGAHTGADDFRISEQGADGDPDSDVFSPSVAYTAAANEYLVAWQGNIGSSGEFEIWAQRLSAAGAEVGGSDFQVSDMGPPSDQDYDAGDPSIAASPTRGEYLVVWDGDDTVNEEFETFGRWFGVLAPTLVETDPRSGANDNNPRVKGSVAADATVDLFTNATCSGAPVVNDALAADLNGAGITVPVADDSFTEFSATAGSGDGRISRCSNSISYVELTPGGAGTPSGGMPTAGPSAFGARTLVTLSLAPGGVPAGGPVKVRVANANGFPVAGTLAGQTTKPISVSRRRRIKLKARSFSVGASARKAVALKLPRALRRLLRRNGRLSLRLTAKVKDPAGNIRSVAKKVTPKLKRKRRR
jgi:hypothetical protein